MHDQATPSLLRHACQWLMAAAMPLFAACAPQAPGGFVSSAASASGGQRVVIDKTQQVLRAYEGDRLFLESRVSTGRRGHSTPNGSFRVQGKERMHYSRRYDNAPMPYSVQYHGNYFIHGFSHVPGHPASHGCIRLPLTGDNPARTFYNWVEIGTPVVVTGDWR